jgi:hypothetical protein
MSVNSQTAIVPNSHAGQLSLCEGDLVRSTNDLYKSYGVGYIQKVRGEQAKVEFNPSLFMQPPYRSENKILHLKELERVDSPLDRASRCLKPKAPLSFG